MADLLQGLEVLEESDIVGAKLDLENLYKYSVGELRFWLQCRGDSLKKCTLKKDIISKKYDENARSLHDYDFEGMISNNDLSIFAFRIKKVVDNGNHTKKFNQTTDKKWVKLKELKKI